MIFSRLSQKNFFLDLAIQCGGIYIWEFKDEEFFFEYPVGDQSLRIELEEMWRLIHPDDLTAFKLLLAILMEGGQGGIPMPCPLRRI